MTSEPKGQILPDSAFGRMLTDLARESETIVEIGTWHGQGSTLCLHRGMVRPTQRMWSIDTSPHVIEEAKAHYSDERISFLLGAVSVDRHTFASPIVTDLLPSQIDLLLIDGGPETGSTDFDILHNRCSIIALDDTQDVKNQRNRDLLLAWNWIVLADDIHTRNGWAIFKRP